MTASDLQFSQTLAGAKSADTPRVRLQPVTETSPLVFVVDDDEMMAMLIGGTLEAGGYRVEIFNDGTKAVALAATQPPDLAMIDLTMPLLSGAETMARLRKLLPGLPVVVVSGLSPTEALAAAPEANAFLAKPFQFSALLQTVASLRMH